MDNAQSLPIDIKLEVGQLTIELGQLMQLEVGSTIDDGVLSYFPKVRAVCGDRTIAEGELVNVDNRIGFRITRVL